VAGGHGVDPRAAERARPFLRGQHDAQPVLARDLLDALDDLHRPRALELVEDDVEQLGGGVAGGRPAAPVALLL
jgi:hypothetical protein